MELWRYGRPIKQLGGRYTLIQPLGRGGMADVCSVWDEQNKREMAAKVMIPDALDTERPQRFLRESERAVSLHHQHVIHVYDYGDRVQTEIRNDPGSAGSDELTVPYMVMERVQGGDLKGWLMPGQACPLDEIVCIFEQLCLAVQYVHRKGMIHRDIKPANILFREPLQRGDEVEVVLCDFGLAVTDNATLSQPYAGSIAYMAPEQRQGDPQQASDIFSLGVLLYQLCTGYLPFQMSQLALPLQPPEKPTLLNPSLPPGLDDVILCTLSNDPLQRFANASLFWQAIQSAVRETSFLSILSANTEAEPGGVVQPPASLLSATPSLEDKRQQASASSPLLMSPDNAVPPVEEQPVSSQLLNVLVEADTAGAKTASVPGTLPSGPMNPHLMLPNRNRQAIIFVALVIVALLLPSSWIVSANSGVPRLATITITPADTKVQDTYVIQGVTSNANPDSLQVTIRQLNSTKPATQQVNLTHVHQDAQPATGNITFFNSSSNTVTEIPGITFQVGSVYIATDENAVIPAATLGSPGQKTVPAHALVAGAAGDIAASAINQSMGGDSSIKAQNQNAFTGGTDTADYNYLKPEDINAVTNADQDTPRTNAQKDITQQMKTGEQLLGDISCNDPKTTEDVEPNAHVANTTANVTVSVSCSAEVYDVNAVKAIAQNTLKKKASEDPGLLGYMLAGNIITPQIQPQTQQDGTIAIAVIAQGIWYYQWTDANKQALLNKIKGMSKTQAQAILKSYLGVDDVKIDMSNGRTTLPNGVNQILLDIKKVKGL